MRLTRRLSRLAAVLLAASTALAGCGFHGLYDVSLPGGADLGSNPYRIKVDFADVLDLVPQSAVKVNDVPVGRVEAIDLVGWHARVTVAVRGDVVLPANATAELRQSSLLGEKFVSLGPPTAEPPAGRLTAGALIPLGRTGRNPEVEEVLGALSLLLNGGGLAQLRTITQELNAALGGRETALRSTISALDTFVTGLDAQRTQIVRAITGLDRLTRTLATQRQVIGTALETLPGAFTVLADQRGQLTRMLTSLDKLGKVGVHVIQGSEADTVAALRALAPTLTQLVAAGRDLPNALELLLTYPFPKQATAAIKGDYTNLDITTDLDLGDLLDNLLGAYASRAVEAGRAGKKTTQGGNGLPVVGTLPTIPGLPLPGGGR
jgi:phospholipid/cholesterol/gamma-HCH transport system substrate-binding protein